MDLEQRAKRQSFRVIISETIMFLTVAITVVVLALIVSGYWLNADFKVERQGMLQINSIPTGASISVDGDTPWFQRTNTSKILSSGEHEIILTKDGYDTWSKTVSISEGLLYRLNYPHLFLKEREKEAVYDVTATTFATASPNRKLILLANSTTSWKLLKLDSDTIKADSIDISKLFSSVSLASGATTGLFNGEILSAEWDNSNEHILFKVNANGSIEWVILDIRNLSKSVNLTRDFATNFEKIKIFANSASTLLVVRNGNLHKIDVDARQISAILVSGIQSFDFYDSEIIYVSNGELNLMRIGNEPVVLSEVEPEAKALLGKFYDEKYIYVLEKNVLSIYQINSFELVEEIEISFSPENIKVGYGGEFIVMNTGVSFATIDMESMQVGEWSADSSHFGWINRYMLYSTLDGELFVYDFDGLNRRSLASNVSNHFPVVITDDKWLYYFSDGQLMREWLIAR